MRAAILFPSLAMAATLNPALAEGPKSPPILPAGLTASMKPVEAYRALPLATQDARLSGEIGTRVVPVYLLANEASRPAKIRVSVMNSVSVLPDVSRMTVSVNDIVVGERNLRASSKPDAFTFEIPPGLLEPGFNAVRFTVRQAHRVDCSRDASYELWTQILPDQSGLVFGGGAAEIRDLRDLPAVRPTRSGAVRIRVRATAGFDSATLDRLSRAVQAAVILGRFAKPTVEVNAEDNDEPGLDIVVGTDVAVAPLLGSQPAGAGPRLILSHDPRTERVVLSVVGSTLDELESALKNLEAAAAAAAAAKPMGTLAGLRGLSADAGLRVGGGESLPLANLGFATQRFAGRYFRQSGLLQMPADFYPGDYGRVTLKLDAAYASGLAPTSRINVRVNGAVVSTIQLQRRGGDTLSKRAAYLPLSAFKPGVNAIDIEAETLTASDAECSATSHMVPRDRFMLAQTSEIDVPALARIGTFPSLSGLIAGALGDSARQEALQVFLPRPAPETIEASLGLVSKIAAVSGRTARVHFALERLGETPGHVLTVGALADIPPATLAAAGLDPETLQQAWHGSPGRELDLQASAPARAGEVDTTWLMHPTSIANWASETGGIRVASADDDALGAALEPATGGPFEGSEAEGIVGRLKSWGAAALHSLHDTLPASFAARGLDDDRSRVGEIVSSASTLVIAQGAATKELGAGWHAFPEVASTTVVVSPTPELLQSSMGDLLNSSLWQQLAGRGAAFDRGESAVRSQAAEAQFLMPTQSLSPSNARLILASWLSRNVGAYIAALAILAVLLSGLTYRLVRSSGGRA